MNPSRQANGWRHHLIDVFLAFIKFPGEPGESMRCFVRAVSGLADRVIIAADDDDPRCLGSNRLEQDLMMGIDEVQDQERSPSRLRVMTAREGSTSTIHVHREDRAAWETAVASR